MIQLDPEKDKFVKTCAIQHAYPTTRVQWSPASVQLEGKDVLATVGDYLRLWHVPTGYDADAGVITRPKHLFDSVSVNS